MEVVVEQDPGVESNGLRLLEPAQAAHEVVPVLVIPEEDLPVQPAPHHVVEDAGGIETSGARHGRKEDSIQLIVMQRPADAQSSG